MKIMFALTILCSYSLYISCGIHTDKTKQRIEDTVKANLLKFGMKLEDLRKIEVNDIEMVCDREVVAKAAGIKQFQVNKSIENVQLDSLMIRQKKTDNVNKSDTGDNEQNLRDIYQSLTIENEHLSVIRKSLDSLLSAYQNADTTKMQNYKATVHAIWRKIDSRFYIYIDKDFNFVTMSLLSAN